MVLSKRRLDFFGSSWQLRSKRGNFVIGDILSNGIIDYCCGIRCRYGISAVCSL